MKLSNIEIKFCEEVSAPHVQATIKIPLEELQDCTALLGNEECALVFGTELINQITSGMNKLKQNLEA